MSKEEWIQENRCKNKMIEINCWDFKGCVSFASKKGTSILNNDKTCDKEHLKVSLIHEVKSCIEK